MATPTKFVRLVTLLMALAIALNPAGVVANAQSSQNEPASALSNPSQVSPTQGDTLHLPFLNQVAPAAPIVSNPPVIQSTVFLSAPTTSEVVSPYGPYRNDPEQGIPDHAYSPFDDPPAASPCPAGGCEAIAGQVVIKFTPEAAAARRAQVQTSAVDSTFAALGIVGLEPVFPQAEVPAVGAMIATPDGDTVPMPDLTAWYRAELAVETTDIPATITALKSNGDVEFAEPDYVRRPVGEISSPASARSSSQSVVASAVHQAATFNDPLYAQQWHLGATHVPEAWEWMTLNGLPAGGSPDIVVAVIDTGVDYTHPDLAANMWVNSQEIAGNGIDDDGNGFVDDIHGVNVVSNQHSGNPQDDHGHGTHVAGIIAAQANNGIGGVGVAYNAKIMAIKAAQYSGVLSTSDIAEAIYYAVAQGADVINMSFGGYTRSQVEEDALTVAFGTSVLVAAAGNDGLLNDPCLWPRRTTMYPAGYNWVLGVMARRQFPNARGEYLAEFSNRDCIVRDTYEYELMAPGVDIMSTLPLNQYASWDGTSMAAPVVSGIAALARTRWDDKNMYSSRFIMGQIATTGPTLLGYTNSAGILFSYETPDAYGALSTTPEPNLSYLEHWLFDTATQDPDNDNDGIVDAGETIDLAVVIRNRWGKADNVQVTLDAWAEGAFQPDPYVTVITGTVDYGAVGSFNWDDNGLIYDSEGVITGVRSPFRFTVDPNTPNNHVIPLRLTMTADNSYDPADPAAPYEFIERFYLLVQRGRELRGLIKEDMTLTKEYFWLIAGGVGIDTGVTVTVTEGTQVQWSGYIPKDAYSEPELALISVSGSLRIEGTYDEPVELFPAEFGDMGPSVYINNNGQLHIRYAEIDTPELGLYGIYGGPNTIDHSHVVGHPSQGSNGGTGFSMSGNPGSISNSMVELWDGINGFNPSAANTVLFDAKLGQGPQRFNPNTVNRAYPFDRGLVTNSVFLQNNGENKAWTAFWGNNPADGFGSKAEASANTLHRANAFLSKYWDPNPNNWMRVDCYSTRPYIGLAHNYWGTTSTTLIEAAITNHCKEWGEPYVVYEPILTTPLTSTYPFVVDVTLSTASISDVSGLHGATPLVDMEPVTFSVVFNRDMNMSVQPQVSFGPDVPMTDYTVHSIDGGWHNARTWVGTFNVTPITGDGYQLIRVAEAVAADDPWLVTGDDAGRFRFEIITSGTEAMNLQATGGEGRVDLSWSQDDFDLLSGFNLYRATSADGTYTRINAGLIPPQIRAWQDTSVTPGIPYYYKFTVVKSDMTESDFSNVAQGTPLDTVPPSVSHTPLTTAAPGLALSLFADVTDNVTVQSVTLYYKPQGGGSYTSLLMTRTTGNRYNATIPAAVLTSPGIHYYIEAFDGISVARSGRAESPHSVAVVDRPTVTTISPQQGTAAGGTNMTISGSNFKSGATVTLGGAVCQSVVVVSSSQITCVASAHFPSTVDIVVTNTDQQSGTLLQGFTYFSSVASLSLPTTGGGQNLVVQVPVNLANVSGLVAASLTISFDNTVIHAASAAIGGLTSGWSLATNTNTPGQVRLSMASPGSAVAGSGVLAYITFEVVGTPGASTALQVASLLLNDGAISVDSSDGSLAVDQVYSVAGSVLFWDGSAAIPGVALTLTGDRVYSGQSNELGAFTVAGAAAGDYTLTPTKSDDVNGISALDASWVLRHDVGLEMLSGHAFTAGDVNRNGAVTAFDAFYILQKSVDLITLPFPGAGGVWRFDPVTRSYSSLNSNRSGQDFTGILLGDVTGNWAAPVTAASTPQTTTTQLELLPSVRDHAGVETSEVRVDPQGQPLYSLEVTIRYANATHTALEPILDDVLEGWMVSSNLATPGEIRIALAGATPLTEASRVFSVRFQPKGIPQSPKVVVDSAFCDERPCPETLLEQLYLPTMNRNN